MIDAVDLKAACSLFPLRPCVKTLRRWIFPGVATPAGRVRLAAVRVGARYAMTPTAAAEFVAATTAARSGRPDPVTEAQRAARRRQLDAVLGM